MFYLLPPDLTKEEYEELLDDVTYLYQEKQVSSMLLINNSFYNNKNIN